MQWLRRECWCAFLHSPQCSGGALLADVTCMHFVMPGLWGVPIMCIEPRFACNSGGTLLQRTPAKTGCMDYTGVCATSYDVLFVCACDDRAWHRTIKCNHENRDCPVILQPGSTGCQLPQQVFPSKAQLRSPHMSTTQMHAHAHTNGVRAHTRSH